MKRSFFYALLPLFTALTQLQAQNLHLGLGAGLNVSRQLEKNDQVNYTDSLEPYTAFHAGLLFLYDLNPSMSLESELLFTRKGSKISNPVTGGTFTVAHTISYLELPLRFRYTFPLGDETYFFVSAGPYISYAVSARLKAKIVYNNGQREQSAGDIPLGNNPRDDRFRRWDYGLSGGTGISLMKILEIGTFYDLGLADIGSSDFNSYTVKNRSMMLSIKFLYL
ncbi:MAG: hypothetical protein CMI36_13665 [Owenweeksia sp.]|nr:hypothetical protein [Owenweeksia sp.]